MCIGRFGKLISILYLAATLALYPHDAFSQQSHLGKYLCINSRLVGIQHSDGNVSSGNFKFSEQRFFLLIRNATVMQGCPNLWSANDGLLNWFSCKAKFEAQIEGAPLLRADNDNFFIGVTPVFRNFLQFDYDTGEFQAVSNNIGSGLFIAEGKFTKVS